MLCGGSCVMSKSFSEMVNSDPAFFEGVEKLLEVWFTRTDGKTTNCDLRKLSR